MTLKFRTRLIVWYVAVLGLLLAITASFLIFVLSREAQKKFDTALWMLATTEAEGIAADLKARNEKTPDNKAVVNHHYRELLGYDARRLEKYVTVVEANGRVADFSDNLNAPLPVDTESLNQSLQGEAVFQTVETDSTDSLRVVYLPVRGDFVSQPFVVIVGLPEKFIGEDLRSFRWMVVFTILLLLALIALTAFILAQLSINPLEKVIAAAESITARNLEDRLPEKSLPEDEIGRLTKVFNQMLGRLEAAFEAQRRFAVRAAHELRTPLTILRGENQVTLNRERSIEEYETQLRSNLEEVEKMEQTIEELLLFARYESGETEMPRREVRLDKMIASVAKELRPLAQEKKIEFLVQAEEAEVFGDEQSLERLACKLIENALHYTPENGRVTVNVFHERESVVLQVEDTGIGISPKDLPQVFERFYRASSARKMRPSGSGIGLAMVAAIARLHNAEIKIESQPERGTVFKIIFPPLS